MKSDNNIAFIINPIAGRRKNRNLVEIIQAEFEKKEIEPIILITKRIGHATKLVAKAVEQGCKVIVAVGGDGTVNEVATACLDKKVVLGIIPCGSGNGLARDLKIPLELLNAINCIVNANEKIIDTGLINNRNFFCTCGTGFDAKIGHEFATQKKRGFATYITTVLREYSKYKPKKYKLKINGKKVKRKAMLVTIANAGQYGNNATIAPGADISDGNFDVCFLKPFPWFVSVGIAIKLFSGKLDRSRYLEIKKAEKVVFTQKKKYKFHVDGEPCKFIGPVEIEIRPQSLTVISPLK